MRTFIALELSREVQEALARTQQTLRTLVPRARWTKPEGTHLTLKFLGEITPHQVSPLQAALDAVAARHQSFPLATAGGGAFPRLSAPRVLWLGLQPEERLMRLAREVEAAISPLGFPSEVRPFQGHLTLARLEGEPWPPDLRQRYLTLTGAMAGVSWMVDRVVLFRSELRPGGAIYSPVHFSVFDTP
ncbi:MAG: RNA 2',3'-cyclic phosphodiesterase [Candidatus Zixiibacteriota bacterium]|nr:MAG: RNA 2',3'-cyclic phosphodiesterase [candidate division Zixibacteria bacterium]